MYIRTQVRGSNQYGGKGRLMDGMVCPHCSHIVSTAKYGNNAAGFPVKIKITKCSVCKKDLFSPQQDNKI